MNSGLQVVRRLSYPISGIWNEASNHHQRVRRLAMFAAWQMWRRIVRKPLTVSLFNGARFVAYPDCPVSSGVFYYRIPNSRAILFLREHVKGGTLIDVGANVGSVSLLLSDIVDHAILFEPNPLAAARARENIARNQLGFEVCEVALSDAAGKVPFECHGGVDPVGHILVNRESDAPGIMTVTRITFDEFVAEHGTPQPPISVIKIDVEGHENSVLRGMNGFLLDQRPPLIMFEYLERTNIRETLQFFRGVQYQVFEIRDSGPVPVGERIEPLQDLFACPGERWDAIRAAKVSS